MHLSIRLIAALGALILFPMCSSYQGGESTAYVEEDVDVWFGPGFYYGIWFSNEDEYWGWREHHKEYPCNRNYYHQSHPIHYHPEGQPEGHGGGGRPPMEHHGGAHGGGRGR